jgi:hypothetical protein
MLRKSELRPLPWSESDDFGSGPVGERHRSRCCHPVTCSTHGFLVGGRLRLRSPTTPRGQTLFPFPDFAWYNPSSGIAAFDALARNFLRTSDSDILPIDLILTPVEGPLREYFEEVTENILNLGFQVQSGGRQGTDTVIHS